MNRRIAEANDILSGDDKGRTRRAAAAREDIGEAAEILKSGGLVAFPTETVYGLGADAVSEAAVAALYAAKGRPSFNPLIAHIPGLSEAAAQGRFTKEAQKLAEALWPGPLTVVVPVSATCLVTPLARAGLDSLALRAPSHSVAQALLRAVGRPIVAPSANLSGRVSPTSAEHVLADLAGRIDLVLDAGPAEVGVESTIVSFLEDAPRLLRAGAVSPEAIEQILGRRLARPRADSGQSVAAPGMLSSHYAPRARVRMNAADMRDGEAGLDFHGRFLGRQPNLDLSPRGDLAQAAANLFAYLRQLDATGAVTIAVAPIPEQGLGEAINDRLRRAAARR